MHIIDKLLVIRADASNSIGSGHIMRSLAIAQTWYDSGGKVTFIVSTLPFKLEQRILDEGFNLIKIEIERSGSINDANLTLKQYKKVSGNYLLIDGYDFKGEYQTKLKKSNMKLVVIDDHHYSNFYCCDLIINKGILAEKIRYQVNGTEPKVLLGPNYTTLRREFLKYKQTRKYPSSPQEILVTFGGADPENVTSIIVESLSHVVASNVNVKIVIGPAYKHKDELMELVNSLGEQYVVLSNVKNMAELMRKSDYAITAGGTTLYELAYMGLPNISLQIIENQKSAKNFDELYKATMYLGSVDRLARDDLYKALKDMNNLKNREKMSDNCFNLIDGEGNNRVICEILKI